MDWQRTRNFALAVALLVAGGRAAPGQTVAEKQQAQQFANQATRLATQQKYAEAADAMAEALKLDPKNDAYLAFAAKTASAAGKHADALKYAQDAVQINPMNPGHHAQLMRSAFLARDFDQAKESANKVVAFGAARAGKEAFAEAKNLLAKGDTLKVDYLYAEALRLHREAKQAEALAAVNEALAVDGTRKELAELRAKLEPLAADEATDRHALKAPTEAERSVEGLAKYLAQPAKNDRAKARAVYRWVTDRVAYDAEAFFADREGDVTPEAVLKSRKCLCAGYINLFAKLCSEAGLEAVTVTGYAKGYGFKSGADLAKFAHGWNAVKLDGNWHLVDPTWGAGSPNEQKKFVKAYREDRFLVSPEQFIFDHFPTDPKWQLLPTAVSKEEFQRWPRVPADLFLVGFTVKDVRASLRADPAPGAFVEILTPPAGCRVTVHAAPLEKKLAAGAKLHFRVEVTGAQAVVIVNGGKPMPLTRKGDVFEGEGAARAGELTVSVKPAGGPANTLWHILKYDVE